MSAFSEMVNNPHWIRARELRREIRMRNFMDEEERLSRIIREQLMPIGYERDERDLMREDWL